MRPFLLLVALLVPASVLAQWPAVKSAAAPRTADGHVNLQAPTPRAPDGRPDLSGTWDKGMLPGEAPGASPFASAGPSRAFRDLKAAVPDLPILP
jgi:hypothetical protein